MPFSPLTMSSAAPHPRKYAARWLSCARSSRRGKEWPMQARNATLPDAFAIEALISAQVHDGTLLPRSIAEICENIRDFMVVENGGEIIGCGALHLYGQHLAEVRSITVTDAAKGRGGGLLLVRALLKEARRHHVTCICLFTRIPECFA